MNQPRAFCISLDNSPRWPVRVEHFKQRGISVERFRGFDGEASGLETTISYDRDNPGTRYRIGPKHIGLTISHIMLWTALRHMPEDSWIILEDDAQFDADWKPRFESAIEHLPPSWDMLFLGSCNCFDKRRDLVTANLYRVFYPSCTHAYMVRRKALDMLLSTTKRIYAPIDCSLVLNTFPKLDVYTILPRIAAQDGTDIRP